MPKGEAQKKGKRQKQQQQREDEVAAAPDALPERLQQRHTSVICGADMNMHTSTVTSAHAYMALDVDNSWSFDHFARSFSVELQSSAKDELEFDVKGVDPAIMNAIRRILIAEVPTVAIEHVFFVDNTSIIADEILAHRLGLVPLNIDPHLLRDRTGDEAPTINNTLVFNLEVECRRLADKTMDNEKVLASHLEYMPHGSQLVDETKCNFNNKDQRTELNLPDDVGPVVGDILLAKLRPGQRIELEAHCTKGIGAEHAKWSPVATAWYRLNPEVVLLKDIKGQRAEQLMKLCEPKEGDKQEPLFRLEGSGNEKRLAVVKTRGNEHHLEKLRQLTGEAEWEDLLQILKTKEHFIFTVQSTGILPPEVLFTEAIDVLSSKCDKLLENLP